MDKEHWRACDRVLDAQLLAMGADAEFGYWPPLMELPAVPENLRGRVGSAPIRERRLPQQLMGLQTVKEALERGHAELEAKIADFSSQVVEYNATLLLMERKAHKDPGITATVVTAFNDLARKRTEIQLVQRNMARLTQGKQLVDEMEWWREYDDLWRKKLEIQSKLVC